jgi:small-conductance mechanosensitive channel
MIMARLASSARLATLIAVLAAACAAAQSVPEITGVPAQAEPVQAAAALPDEPAPAETNKLSKRAENAELLRVAMRRLEAADSADNAAAQEVALYKTIEALLAQQETIQRQTAELQKRHADIEIQLRTTRAAPSERQARISFSEYDRLVDELAAEVARVHLLDDRLAADKQSLERAQKGLAKSETKFRQSHEAYEAGKTGMNAAELSTALEQARQATTVAAETVTLRSMELGRSELALAVQRLAVELKREQVGRAAPRVTFSEANLHEQLAQIGKQEEAANTALATAHIRRQAADDRVREVQQQISQGSEGEAALEEQLAACRREHERWSDEADLLTQQLQRLAQLRLAWDRRFAIASATSDRRPTPEELKTWQKEARSTLDQLASEASTRIERMTDLRNHLATVADKAEAAKDGAAAVVSSINLQRAQLEEMLRSQQASLMSIESTRRVYQKLSSEIGDNIQLLSPTVLAAGAWQQITDIWNYEVFSVGEGRDAKFITVEKIVHAIVVFALGWLISRVLARIFITRFLKRFRLSKDANAVLGSFVYYVLMAIVVLVTLKWISVPLTAFTILGGALAIGVGFGSQALINNFIGGLIMLAERPIRLGENITIGGHAGVVDEVGFRSTKLRTPTDHLVTIPNSTLVNDPIENVSRRRTIRRLLNIAVSGDTPREKLAEAVAAIRDVLNEKEIRERIHPIVGFEEFPPRVYFNDYNANSFNIQIVYWYAPPEWWDYLDHCERVNFRIMDEFDRLGVRFAFNLLQFTDALRENATSSLPSDPKSQSAGRKVA